MHELGITQGIIDRAREAAVANGARKVTDLYLTMTPAADFTFDSIEMYFEMLTDEDDLFQGARLHLAVGARRGDLPELQRRVHDRGAAADLPAVRVGGRAPRPDGAHGAAHRRRHRRRRAGQLRRLRGSTSTRPPGHGRPPSGTTVGPPS